MEAGGVVFSSELRNSREEIDREIWRICSPDSVMAGIGGIYVVP